MKTESKLLIFASMLAFLFIGCSSKDETNKDESKKGQTEVIKIAAESIKQIKMETTDIKMEPYTGYITIPAKVITNQDNEAHIGSLIQGRVHQVFAKIGDYVKVGQLLMTIESPNIGDIKAGFLKAKAAYDYTRTNYERQKKLFEGKIGSQKALLESQAENVKALAEFNAEEKRIHSLGLTEEDVLETTRQEGYTMETLPIKSLINGIVVERNIVMGQLVDATTTAFKIININSVWIDGRIYEKDITKITKTASALFTTPTYQNEKFNGKIIYIGQIVDEQSRTITVRGEFVNLANKLKPQMFGELKIPLSANAKAIMVPEEAVITETGQQYVFVQTSDSTFEQRKVITGISINNKIEIKEGLKEGEKIVSKGVFYIKSVMKKDEIEGD